MNLIFFVTYKISEVLGTVVKNPSANPGDARDMDLIPGLGRFPGIRNGNLLQYSCFENSTDRGAWWVTVHGVTIYISLIFDTFYFSVSEFSFLKPQYFIFHSSYLL